MRDLQQIAWWLSASSQVLAAISLLRWRLWRAHGLLFAFLLCGVARSAALLPLNPGRDPLYTWIWLYTEPLLMLVQAAMAAEIFLQSTRYRRAAEDRPLLLVIGVAVGISVTLLGVYFVAPSESGWYRTQWTILMGRWGLWCVLAAFLVSVIVYSKGSAALATPNLRTHRGIATAYFVMLAAGQLVMAGWRETLPAVNVATLLLSAACYLAWGLTLKPPGESLVGDGSGSGRRELPPWKPAPTVLASPRRRVGDLLLGFIQLWP